MTYAPLAAMLSLTMGSIVVASGAGQQPIRVGIDLVHFAVAVTDRDGAPIAGLKADDFEVVEEGRPQRIRFFSGGETAIGPPLHVGFLLDASGSMERDIRDVRTAAIKFLNQTEHAVDVTLVDFDTEVSVARYGADDYPRLIERIRMRKPGGYTAFYDALGVYLRAASEQEGQKVLVAYTDGGDTRSAINAGDVMDLLKLSDVTMYALGYLEHQTSAGRNNAQSELRRFTSMTGGQAFFPTSLKELDGVYGKILHEISARYTLGYTSSDDRADGSWRDVQIKLKRSDLKGAKLRTRPGYFARLARGTAASR